MKIKLFNFLRKALVNRIKPCLWIGIVSESPVFVFEEKLSLRNAYRQRTGCNRVSWEKPLSNLSRSTTNLCLKSGSLFIRYSTITAAKPVYIYIRNHRRKTSNILFEIRTLENQPTLTMLHF